MTDEDKPQIPAVALDEDDETAQAARVLVFARAKRAELEAKLDEIKKLEDDAAETIKEALGGEDGPEATATFEGRPIATWYKNTTHRLNQKRFRKEQPDLFKEYYEESIARRFVAVVES